MAANSAASFRPSPSGSGGGGRVRVEGSRSPLWNHSPCFVVPCFSTDETSSRSTLNVRALGRCPASWKPKKTLTFCLRTGFE